MLVLAASLLAVSPIPGVAGAIWGKFQLLGIFIFIFILLLTPITSSNMFIAYAVLYFRQNQGLEQMPG